MHQSVIDLMHPGFSLQFQSSQMIHDLVSNLIEWNKYGNMQSTSSIA